MMEQDRKEYLDKDESEKMCSSKIGEAGEMCSPADTDTCGDCGIATKGECLKTFSFSVIPNIFYGYITSIKRFMALRNSIIANINMLSLEA